MVKALTFKGDPKKSNKKRKRTENSTAIETTTSQPPSNEPTADDEDDTTWVSASHTTDISGPILILLPSISSSPPTCLATDALGKIHASPLENIIPDTAPHRSAEPHLVSQVWIATRVVGSDKAFTFKGHHGRFLGCDSFGFWGAGREAVGAEETVVCEEVDGEGEDAGGDAGVFALKTARGTFLSVKEDGKGGGVEIRGDAEEAGASSRIRVRMQAKFKPQLRVEKAEKVRAKISRRELEAEVGRRLEEDEVKMLKRARREGNYHEAVLDVKVKGKHDKFA